MQDKEVKRAMFPDPGSCCFRFYVIQAIFFHRNSILLQLRISVRNSCLNGLSGRTLCIYCAFPFLGDWHGRSSWSSCVLGRSKDYGKGVKLGDWNPNWRKSAKLDPGWCGDVCNSALQTNTQCSLGLPWCGTNVGVALSVIHNPALGQQVDKCGVWKNPWSEDKLNLW